MGYADKRPKKWAIIGFRVPLEGILRGGPEALRPPVRDFRFSPPRPSIFARGSGTYVGFKRSSRGLESVWTISRRIRGPGTTSKAASYPFLTRCSGWSSIQGCTRRKPTTNKPSALRHGRLRIAAAFSPDTVASIKGGGRGLPTEDMCASKAAFTTSNHGRCNKRTRCVSSFSGCTFTTSRPRCVVVTSRYSAGQGRANSTDWRGKHFRDRVPGN